MLPSEMLIQEVVKDCASFGSANGSHLLHLCFDHRTEYDADVVLIKIWFSQLFAQNVAFLWNFLTFKRWLKKECLKLE